MIGKTIGPYEVVAKLGEGGMGEVYRARDPRLGRETAIKVLPPAVADNPERLRRFEQEARAASALNHPNILTVFDVGEHHGIRFLVTELLEGETLRERLQRGPVLRAEALDLAIQLARALAAAHARGIVHRDLKPANLFLTRDGRLKILDFGLALWTPDAGAGADAGGASTTAALTEVGAVLGTVGYMAPEQARGQRADARADLFAVGCILYEMLSGRRAFDRGTTADTLSAILNEDPLAWLPEAGLVPEDLARVIRHCLEKDPARRFQSAGDVAFALESLREAAGSGAAAVLPRRAAPRRRWLVPAIATLVLAGAAVAAGLWWHGAGPAPPQASSIRSIAVLPFVNAGGTANLDYLADGITESLIGKLSPLPGLTVLARSTVFQFKHQDVDPLEAGRRLKVGAVLSGRIDERGARLTVGAELVDVASGAQLWGGRFNRAVSDVFAIEEEVARQIADRLAVRLGKGDEDRLASQPTANGEAYRLYLEGRNAWYQRTMASVRRSLGLFQQAVALDPQFALAWTGIADAYVVGWAGYIGLPPAEAYARGKEAAERAVQIDPNLAEAHASLATILWEHDWDWAGAEREMQRAIDLNPGYATAHQSYGEFLYTMGRFDASMAEIRRAIELDPAATIARSVFGWAQLASGDADAAVTTFRSILNTQPGFIDATDGLAYATYAAHRPAHEVFAAFLADDTSLGLAPERAVAFRRAFERDGLLAYWRARLQAQLGPAAHTDLANPINVQWSYAMLGEYDHAMDVLERMYDERDPSLTYLKTGAIFHPLRDQPRFQALLARMHFPASAP